MALNCTGQEPPCGECTQCRRIDAGVHADVQTVTLDTESESAKKSISVEQMRKVEAGVALAPYEGRTRVVIIDPADLMSDGAQNSFLKTLEEPPPHAVFVLVTANEERLLETIRSRCTRIEFQLATAEAIEAALVHGNEPERTRLLARLAAGRVAWALDAAKDAKVFARRQEALETARSVPRMPLAERFALAEKMSEAFKREREPVLRQLDEWAGWWRDVMLAQSGAGESVTNVDMADEVQGDARMYPRAEVARFLQTILETRSHISENVQSRLALDALMLAVPGMSAARAR